MEITPYLNFKGDCAAAFAFYAKTLGGTIEFMQTHGESPMRDHVPPDWHDKVMHVRLTAGGRALMGSDAPPDRYSPPRGLYVSVHVPLAEAERIFKAFAEGGTVAMPLQKTFWSPGFGMVTDRFGIPWMLNAE